MAVYMFWCKKCDEYAPNYNIEKGVGADGLVINVLSVPRCPKCKEEMESAIGYQRHPSL